MDRLVDILFRHGKLIIVGWVLLTILGGAVRRRPGRSSRAWRRGFGLQPGRVWWPAS